ncbi:uncharacterized protein BYT42DRAFT_619009 [Radiomyces spectabilis]|uniref:uncharacterized protein n=1 Tax=Radiomyces spectabilis TaxID=64574 RepID=UPI00221F0DAC|nr:uncharacterized protein BYT42DRAFT_619009 [Radiomyces spectabilis]KAI8364152.1 hypothetical protein BYT42DRAFT_619009 [Radiomyces spectabilis]
MYFDHSTVGLLVRPGVSVLQRTLSLDDYLQLQALLRYEQAQRQQQYHHHQPHHPHHHAGHAHYNHQHMHPYASPDSWRARREQARLQQAIENLRLLKENYRREKCRQIERCLANYRQRALIRAVQQEEEERFYRQCLAAAIERQRANAFWRQYVANREATGQKPAATNADSSEEEDPEFLDYRSQRLASLLKTVFGQVDDTLVTEQQEQDQHEPKEEDSEEEQQSYGDLWNYIAEQQAQRDENSDEYVPENETPRSAFLAPEHEQLRDEKTCNETAPQTEVPKQEAPEKEESPRVEEEESEEEPKEDTIKALPPVDSHVMTLKDLLNELVAVPVNAEESDEPKPSGIWAADDPHIVGGPEEKEEPSPSKQLDIPDFAPQHVVTAAEPSPMKEIRQGIASLEAKEAEELENEAQRVHEIAAQQRQDDQVSPIEPLTKENPPANEEADEQENDERFGQLKKLKEELDGIRVKYEHQLSGAPLQFQKSHGTLLLTATTANNRAFWDARTRSCDSEGNENIRRQRRALVKEAEAMLETLDEHKQDELEKARHHDQSRRSSAVHA